MPVARRCFALFTHAAASAADPQKSSRKGRERLALEILALRFGELLVVRGALGLFEDVVRLLGARLRGNRHPFAAALDARAMHGDGDRRAEELDVTDVGDID